VKAKIKNMQICIVDSERNFNGSTDPMITTDRGFYPEFGPGFWILVVWKFGSWISTSRRKAHVLFFICLHAVEKMTRTSNALRRDGSVMADSDLL